MPDQHTGTALVANARCLQGKVEKGTEDQRFKAVNNINAVGDE
jgi:hypothetical protein